KRDVAITFPKDWEQPIELTLGQAMLASSAYAYDKSTKLGQPVMAIAFRNLPGAHPYTMFLLKGVYLHGQKYYGEVFVRHLTSELAGPALKEELRATLNDSE